MRSLTYFSTEAQRFSGFDLKVLLASCQKNNARLGITGMLLYKRGSFLQAIEGSDEAVTDLFSVIRADPRHRDVVEIANHVIDKREFADWTMAFRNLDDVVTNGPQVLKGLDRPFTGEEFRREESHAHRLLLYFANAPT